MTTSYTFAAAGTKTLWAFAKDAAGVNDTVIVTVSQNTIVITEAEYVSRQGRIDDSSTLPAPMAVPLPDVCRLALLSSIFALITLGATMACSVLTATATLRDTMTAPSHAQQHEPP